MEVNELMKMFVIAIVVLSIRLLTNDYYNGKTHRIAESTISIHLDILIMIRAFKHMGVNNSSLRYFINVHYEHCVYHDTLLL